MRARYVLENCLAILEEDPPPEHATAVDLRLVFLGEDQGGVPIEVIAVETNRDLLTVIHAMELRSRYQNAYEEVRRCSG